MNLTIPVAMGAMFGGACTLVGSTPQLTANGILSKMCNTELRMFDYTLVGAILFLVYMVYVLTIGRKIGNKIWANRKQIEEDISVPKQEEEPKVNRFKIIAMLMIFISTIVSFIGAWIPTATTAIIAAIACVVLKCTSQKSIIKKMDWSVVFVLAGCLGIASGITKGGAGDLIGKSIASILNESVAPIVIFAVIVVITMIVSNFITNSTAVVIMLPIALSLCNTMSLNPIAFTLGIVYAANLTFSTPLANAQTAMTLVAGYKFSDYIRYTWPLAVGILVALITVIPMVYSLTV